jgi:hypothetical protein
MAALVESNHGTFPLVIGLGAMGFAAAQAVVVTVWNPLGTAGGQKLQQVA